MKKFLILTMLVVFLAALPVLGADNSVKVEQEIYSQLNSQESVKIIVELADTSATLSTLVEKRASAKDLQDKFIEKINRKDLKTLSQSPEKIAVSHKLATTPTLIIEVDKAGLEKLASQPDVKKISADKVYHILDTTSNPQINATTLWAKAINGTNFTGAGETICILDTGINFTHADLGGCTNVSFQAGNCSKVLAGIDYINNDNTPLDDNGHGTHVAGIAAANNSLQGVAPQASIVMIKVCTSAGGCQAANIALGIDWCTNYSTNYNISVISISIGEGFYNISNCPTTFDTQISAAYNAGITLAVAAGNSRINGVAYPACNPQAIAVGAVNSADTIFDSYNRGDALDVLAPGISINSTYYQDNYATASGTSMAAPHVAGAAALLHQFLKVNNGLNATPKLINDTLINTGLKINDTALTNLNFSRINIWTAVVSLDNKTPILAMLSPQNQTYIPTNATHANITLNYSSIDALLEQTWYAVDAGANTTLSGNTTILASAGTHTLKIYNNDSAGNSNSQQVTFSVLNETPSITLVSPVANYNSSSKSITFNCSAEDNLQLANITIYGNWAGGWHANQTANLTGTSNWTAFTINASLDGAYLWNCEVSDNASNKNRGANRTVTADTTPPVITLDSPNDGGTFSSSSIKFSWRVSDTTDIRSCNIIYGSNSRLRESIPKDILYETTLTGISNGNYSWKIQCTDTVNLVGNSSNRTFSVSVSSGGGTGNSGSSSTSTTDDEESSGGGGGGGAAGDTADLTKQSQTFLTVSAGAQLTMKVDKNELAVSQVSYKIGQDAETVKVTAEKKDSGPAAAPSGKAAYQYFDITTTTPSNLLTAATIEFRIKKEWLTSENVNEDTIKLFRYDSEWKALETTKGSTDNTYVYYAADTPGFSSFLVAGEKSASTTASLENKSSAATGLGILGWTAKIFKGDLELGLPSFSFEGLKNFDWKNQSFWIALGLLASIACVMCYGFWHRKKEVSKKVDTWRKYAAYYLGQTGKALRPNKIGKYFKNWRK